MLLYDADDLQAKCEKDQRFSARLQRLLQERRIQRPLIGPRPVLTPLLRTADSPVTTFPGAELFESISVDTFVDRQWPRTVQEKIERSLVNLAETCPDASHAQPLDLREISTDARRWAVVAENENEQRFVLIALIESKWLIVRDPSSGASGYQVTAAGWKKYDRLTRGPGNRANPVFVMMDFGAKTEEDAKKDRRPLVAESERLFEVAIRPAAKAAGYEALKADSSFEANKYLMDKIMSDIRKAPFAIADVTYPNLGVYYELGFAIGQKIPVLILCLTPVRKYGIC